MATEIIIDLKADVEKANAALEAVDKSLADMAKEADTSAQALEDVGQSADTMSDGLEGASESSEKIGQSTRDSKLSFTELKSALDVGREAIDAVRQAYDATVGAALSWSNAIGDLSKLTGTNAEETSKMAATFELAGLDMQTFQEAIKGLSENGLQMNIATIKKLAQEYQSIQDPVQKNTFLFKKFGDSGLAMAEIMSRDAKELDALGIAAAVSGKVIGGEAVAAAEKMQLQLDKLKQQISGAGVSIGATLIPAISYLIDVFDTWRKLTAVVNLEIQKNIGIIDQQQLETRTAAVVAGDYSAVYEQQVVPAIVDATDAQKSNTTVVAEAISPWQDLTDVLGKAGEAMTEDAAAATAAAIAQGQAEQAAKDLESAERGLALALAGPVKAELETYYQKQKDAGAAIVDTKTKLEELSRQPHLTEEQRQQMADLKGLYDQQTQIYADNAKAHEDATARIVFGFIQQAYAADGLSIEEIGALKEIGVELGIYDQKTADTWANVEQAVREHGTNAGALVDDLRGRIVNLPSSHNIDINVNVHQNGTLPGGIDLGDEGFGGWTAPPGTTPPPPPPEDQPGPGGMLAATSGNSSGNKSGNTYILNVYTQQSAGNVATDFEIMKVMAG